MNLMSTSIGSTRSMRMASPIVRLVSVQCRPWPTSEFDVGIVSVQIRTFPTSDCETSVTLVHGWD